MTKEEAEKFAKYWMCKDCGIYLGGGKCSNTCKVIEVIETLEQCEEREKGECPYYAG